MFESILGNDSIKTMLKQAINHNKVSHSYLMIGISGIGKKMIATEFAKAILCIRKWKKKLYKKSDSSSRRTCTNKRWKSIY